MVVSLNSRLESNTDEEEKKGLRFRIWDLGFEAQGFGRQDIN